MSQNLDATEKSDTKSRIQDLPISLSAIGVLYQKMDLLDTDQITQEGNNTKPFYVSQEISSLLDFFVPLF